MGVEGLQNESVITVMVCWGSRELGGGRKGGRVGGRKGGREEGRTNTVVGSTLESNPYNHTLI